MGIHPLSLLGNLMNVMMSAYMHLFFPYPNEFRWAANGLVRPGGKYYYVKAGSSIVAFAVC
jgi:aspartyl aminopeptidase